MKKINQKSNSNKQIIQNINKNTQQKTKEINQIIDPKKKYKINFTKTGKTKQLKLSNNKKDILIGDYGFYGIIQPGTNLWIWASSIPGVDIKHIKNIQRMRDSAHLFEGDSSEQSTFYYQLLTQDVLFITEDKMLDWINELLLYLSNDLYYFNPINSEGNMQFLTLVTIKEKYI